MTLIIAALTSPFRKSDASAFKPSRLLTWLASLKPKFIGCEHAKDGEWKCQDCWDDTIF